LSLTPVVLFLLTVVLCFLWYDMQNRFTRQTDRILANQADIRAALDAMQRTESNVQHIQDTLGAAQRNVGRIEKDAEQIRQVLKLSEHTLRSSRESQDRIEDANRTVRIGAEAVEKIRLSSEESLRQSRENAAHLAESTDDIVRGLMIGQRRTDQRLEDIQDRLQKLMDHKK
jgi:chromosome segregation ATPase